MVAALKRREIKGQKYRNGIDFFVHEVGRRNGCWQGQRVQ